MAEAEIAGDGFREVTKDAKIITAIQAKGRTLAFHLSELGSQGWVLSMTKTL